MDKKLKEEDTRVDFYYITKILILMGIGFVYIPIVRFFYDLLGPLEHDNYHYLITSTVEQGVIGICGIALFYYLFQNKIGIGWLFVIPTFIFAMMENAYYIESFQDHSLLYKRILPTFIYLVLATIMGYLFGKFTREGEDKILKWMYFGAIFAIPGILQYMYNMSITQYDWPTLFLG